jgi:N-acetyl-anhydromuramyl-L-alanine amidase AmpD
MGKKHWAVAVALCLAVPSAVLAAEKPPTIWSPAASCNYTASSTSRGIYYVVIHTVEGSATGAVSWFKNCASNVSAHYVVAYSGTIYQCLNDGNIGWHAGNWYFNQHSIGIEHEGWTYQNNWTDAQYKASAKLTRWICLTYGIPMDRSHIIGHKEVPGATHTDPGPYFNWTYYMSLVKQESGTSGGSTAIQKCEEVTTTDLNVRTGPSTSNSILGQVHQGQRYVAIESSGGWYKIYFKNNTGWCYGGYLAQKTGVTGRKVAVDTLNVRSGPGTGYSVVGTVSLNQKYVQMASSGSWVKICWGGGQYWVYSPYTSSFGM